MGSPERYVSDEALRSALESVFAVVDAVEQIQGLSGDEQVHATVDFIRDMNFAYMILLRLARDSGFSSLADVNYEQEKQLGQDIVVRSGPNLEGIINNFRMERLTGGVAQTVEFIGNASNPGMFLTLEAMNVGEDPKEYKRAELEVDGGSGIAGFGLINGSRLEEKEFSVKLHGRVPV